jgi:exodeoxyribonuclease-5
MDTLATVQQFIFSFFPHHPTEGQQKACAKLSEFLFDADPHAAFLLRGYAGTGKTSLVSALIQAAPHMQIKTLLLAPTGRAAKVLSGYSHQEAFTIHKKIYLTVTDAGGGVHVMRAPNKYSYTLFIVDEASMIGMSNAESGISTRHSLLEDLIDFVHEGNHCRLLLIGDTAQLPPVGTLESLALDADYLRSVAEMKLFESELVEVVRQEQASGILHNATLIRRQISEMNDDDEVQFPLFDIKDYADVIQLPGDELEDTLNHEYSNGSQEEVVFITRSNKRANLFNQEIRNRVLYREEMLNAGDYIMVVKNNYFWLDKDSAISFIANGDIMEVMGVRNHQDLYGFHYVDATLRFVDYPDMDTIDCKLLLDTLISESPALTGEESQQLYDAVMHDYENMPNRSARIRAIKENPYYNALQVKFAYALTCHKTQGGQWPIVFIDQGYVTDNMMNKEYLRWLYTALTRATSKVYLLGFNQKFFGEE